MEKEGFCCNRGGTLFFVLLQGGLLIGVALAVAGPTIIDLGLA